MIRFLPILFFFLIFSNALIYSQGNCLHFDGSNDIIEVPSSCLTGQADYTIEMWFITEKSGSYSRMIGWDNFAVDIALNSNRLFFYDGSVWMDSNINVNDGSWHHVAATRNGLNRKVYIDGILVLDYSRSGGHNMAGLKFRIGGKAVGGNISSTLWQGKIDEIRIWEYALTQAEIQNGQYCELFGNEPCLCHYYNFNQGSSGGNNNGINTLIDHNPNGIDGTMSNFALTGNTSNWVSSSAGVSGNCSNIACSALPVELLEFLGMERNGKIYLNWTTTTEINNAGYEIEKSKDGITWETLGFIQGSGNSQIPQQYQSTDKNPFPGPNYYRLRQINFDGSFEYSSIIEVSHSKDSDIFIYPNPVSKNLNIHGLKEGKFVIYDSFGRILKQGNFNNGVVDVSDLPRGILIIRTMQDWKTIEFKILKT